MTDVIRKLKCNLIQKKKRIVTALDKLTNYNNFVDEVFVISFPKSGRTWLRLMLEELDIKLSFTHAKSGHFFNTISYDVTMYIDRKVIFLVRDPRDVVVSGYFQLTKRNKKYDDRYDGGISDFIRDEKDGIRKVVAFYNPWNEHKDATKDFFMLKYEDMHLNTILQLENVLKFLSIDNIDNQIVAKAVDSCCFEKMHKLEKQGHYNKKYREILTPSNNNDPESFKTRKGKVGGYIDYLEESDINYCNSIMREMKCPWYCDTL